MDIFGIYIDAPTLLMIIGGVLLVVGLIKKLMWLCIVGGVIAAILGFTQPDVMKDMTESVSSFFGGSVDPMKDEDYEDMIGEDAQIPNQGFGDIG